MIVVSDTTPLISLLKIDKIWLLEKLFGKIFLPEAVFNELVVDKRFYEEAQIIRSENCIEVRKVCSPEAVDILRRATGRDISKQLGHKVMGTIGIIMVAYEENVLTSEDVKECIEQLKKSGRHIGQRFYNILLSKLES